MADAAVKHEGGASVVRTVTTRTEEHVAVVTLERKDDLTAGSALTTTAGSAHVGGVHGGGATHLSSSTTTVPSLTTSSAGGASHRETSQTRESHRTTTASSGGAHYAPITGPVTTSASNISSSAYATSTVPVATVASTEKVSGATATMTIPKPPTVESESYTVVKTKSKAAPKVTTESSSKFITTSGGGNVVGGYTADTEHTMERHVPQQQQQVHHEHYQHHTAGSANIERKVPMITTASSEKKTFQQYSKKSRTEGAVVGGGSGHETDTDTEDEKRRTATSSRTGYHSATEQNFGSHKHHHVHANYDNEYHDRKKREGRLRVLRNRVRRRMAIRRWCRCDSVCFLLILAVLHILVASTIIGLNISAWIISGMWLIKVIDFLFWVFALGFLAFLTGVVGVVITYKLRSPYGVGGGVNRSRTINTLRGSHLHGGIAEYNAKEEERLVGFSSHAIGAHTGAIPNDHLNDLGAGGLNDLEETETSYGDIPAQRRKHRIHYALLFLLCLIVIVLAVIAYLLITYDYHEPIAQRRESGRDYSVFEDSRRSPQEATYSKYFTNLYSRVNNVSEEEQIDQAHTLNTLRSLLITFVALELGLAIITLGLAFVYLFRGYRLHCPCLVSDSSSNDLAMSNGGTLQQPVIVSPSQMTLGSRGGGAGGLGGTLGGYGAGSGHVVREFDREERETVRLVA